jgi:hypothetical protein
MGQGESGMVDILGPHWSVGDCTITATDMQQHNTVCQFVLFSALLAVAGFSLSSHYVNDNAAVNCLVAHEKLIHAIYNITICC